MSDRKDGTFVLGIDPARSDCQKDVCVVATVEDGKIVSFEYVECNRPKVGSLVLFEGGGSNDLPDVPLSERGFGT